jgi:hypothetical protein
MLVEELRRHRARQAEELLPLGVPLTDDHQVVTQQRRHTGPFCLVPPNWFAKMFASA